MKTSAIVTCHNYGCFLKKCLDSLLGQSLSFDEILLVDDGSSDETRDVWAASYRDRVRYLRVEFNNQTRARRAGLEASSDELVVFLDADDWIGPEFHARLKGPFDRDPLIGLVSCETCFVLEGEDHNWFPRVAQWPRTPEPYSLWQANHLTVTTLFRKKAFMLLPEPDPVAMDSGRDLGEDWQYWLGILNAGWKGEVIREKLFFRRIHALNLSREAHSDPSERERLLWKIREQYAPYDLAVIVCLNGMKRGRAGLMEQLGRMTKPVRTQMVFLDPGEESDPEMELRPFATHYLNVTRSAGEGNEAWMGRALEFAKERVRSREVLILSGDIEFGRNLLVDLSGLRESRGAAMASPAIHARAHDRVMAWRAFGGDPGRGIYFVPVSRGVKRVFAASLECVLMDARTYHECPFEGAGRKYAHEGLIPDLGQWTADTDRRWLVSGRIRVHSGRRRKHESPIDARPSERPFVSVIVPVLNAEKTIRELLESLEDQDYPRTRYEIIVVDNGSGDRSVEIVREFRKVRVLHESRPGSYAARNRGIRETRSEWIAFIDADCRADRSWLRELIESAAGEPDTGAVAGANSPLDGNSFLSRHERRFGGYRHFEGEEGGRPAHAITLNVLYRRRVFEEAGLFNESAVSGSDVEMSWRMQRECGWCLLVLKDRARVVHRDVTNWRSYLQRQYRLGRGHFHAFSRAPELLLAHYHWLPLSRLEVALQCLRQWFLSLYRREWRNWPFPVNVFEHSFFLFRLFFQKLGYLYEMKIETIRRTGRIRCCIVEQLVEGLAYGPPVRPLSENTARICVGPVLGVGRSWLKLLLRAAGMTDFWRLPDGTWYIESWQLFPERECWPGNAQRNRALTAGRIRRKLRRRTPYFFIPGRSFRSAEALKWRPLFGDAGAQIQDPAQALMHASFTYPVVLCLLPDGPQGQCTALLERMAAESQWPVWVWGIDGDEQGLPPGVFGLRARTGAVVSEEILKRAGLLVAAGSGALKQLSLIPLPAKQPPRFPVLCLSAKSGVVEGLRIETSGSEEDLLRALRREQLFPLWCRASALEMPSAVSRVSAGTH